MFRPKKQPTLTKLEARWEKKLRKQGEHPAEIVPLTALNEAKHPLAVVPIDGLYPENPDWVDETNLRCFGSIAHDPLPGSSFAQQAVADAFPTPVTLSNHPQAQYWQQFSALVESLDPDDWEPRQLAFFRAFAATGSLDKARRTLRRPPANTTVTRWLKKLRKPTRDRV